MDLELELLGQCGHMSHLSLERLAVLPEARGLGA